MSNQKNKIIAELLSTILISAIIPIFIVFIFIKLIGVEDMLLGFLIVFSLLFLALLSGEVKI